MHKRLLLALLIFFGGMVILVGAFPLPASQPVHPRGSVYDFSGQPEAKLTYFPSAFLYGPSMPHYRLIGTNAITSLLPMNATDAAPIIVPNAFGDYSGIDVHGKPYCGFASTGSFWGFTFTVMFVYRITQEPVSGSAYLMTFDFRDRGAATEMTDVVFGIRSSTTNGITEFIKLNDSNTYSIHGQAPVVNVTGVKIATVNATTLEVRTGRNHVANVALNTSAFFDYDKWIIERDFSALFTRKWTLGGAVYALNTKSYDCMTGHFAEIALWYKGAQSLQVVDEWLNYTNSKYGIWATDLAFVVQPASQWASNVITATPIVIELRSPLGKVIRDDQTTNATLSIISSPVGSSSHVFGDTSVLAENGIVRFKKVGIRGSMGVYRVRISVLTVDGTAYHIDSNTFTLFTSVNLVFTTQPPVSIPVNTPGAWSRQPAVAMLADPGAAIAGVSGDVSFSIRNSAGLIRNDLVGTTTVTMANGQVQAAANLRFAGPAGVYYIDATFLPWGTKTVASSLIYVTHVLDWRILPPVLVPVYGTPFSVSIALYDANGRVTTDDSSTVVTLSTTVPNAFNQTSGIVVSTTASNGVAVFTNLVLVKTTMLIATSSIPGCNTTTSHSIVIVEPLLPVVSIAPEVPPSLGPTFTAIRPSNGHANDTVTITGTNFASNMSTPSVLVVWIGKNACTQTTIVSSSVILATIPVRTPGRVFAWNVTVGNISTPLVFQYIPPAPVVLAVMPLVLYLKQPTVITMYGRDFQSGQVPLLVTVGSGGTKKPCMPLFDPLDTFMMCTLQPSGAAGQEWPVQVSTTSLSAFIDTPFTLSNEYTCDKCNCSAIQTVNAAGECQCPAGLSGAKCDTPLIYVQMPQQNASTTSEDGDSVSFSVTLRVAPTHTVSIVLSVSDPNEARLSTYMLEWQPGNSAWLEPRQVVVYGLMDSIRDGNVSYTVSMSKVDSLDPAYAAITLFAPIVLTNIDSRPVLKSLSPATITLQQPTLVSLVLQNIDRQGFIVMIDGRQMHPPLSPRFHRLQEQSSLFQCIPSNNNHTNGDCNVAFNVTANHTGYVDMIVINQATGTVLLSSASIFFTEVCINENWWGYGAECTECPKGGMCPGGKRLWPLQGYWIAQEEGSLAVQPCRAPSSERCMGGKTSACGLGYEGYMCGSCSDGFFEDKTRSGACVACSGDGGYLTGVFANLVLVLVLAFATGLLDDEPMGTLCAIVMALQGIYAVGQMAGMVVPEFTGQFYAAMGIFVLNVNINELKCSIPNVTAFGISFLVFWLTIACSLAVGFLLVLLFRAVSTHHEGHRVSIRTSRMVVTTSMVYHFLGVQLGLQAMYCVSDPRNDVLVLLADPTLVCFSGLHLVYVCIGIVLVLAWTIGACLGMYWLLYIRHGKANVYTDMTIYRVTGVMYAALLERHRWFAIFGVVVNIIFAALIAFGTPLLSNIIALAVVGFGLVLKIVLRPFSSRIEFAAAIVVDLVCALATSIVIASEAYDVSASSVNAVWFASQIEALGYILFAGTVVAILIYGYKFAWELFDSFKKRRERQKQLHHTVQAIASSVSLPIDVSSAPSDTALPPSPPLVAAHTLPNVPVLVPRLALRRNSDSLYSESM